MAMQFGPSSVESIKEVVIVSSSSSSNDKSTTTTTGVHGDEIRLLAKHMQEKHESFISDGMYFGILSKFQAPVKSNNNNNKNTTTTTPSLLLSAKKDHSHHHHLQCTIDRLELENAELCQRIAAKEQDHVEMEQRLRAALEDCVRVKDEMRSLRQELSQATTTTAADCNYYYCERMECRSELKRLRIENIEFRRLGATEKEVRRLNRELNTLQDNLDAKSNDCKTLEMMLRIADEDCAKLNRAAAMAPRPSNYKNYMRE
jgi:hypothetical protein